MFIYIIGIIGVIISILVARQLNTIDDGGNYKIPLVFCLFSWSFVAVIVVGYIIFVLLISTAWLSDNIIENSKFDKWFYNKKIKE
jgi:preprotein translocase subunit Sss1